MRILMVCLGNICRSPLAKVAFAAAADNAGFEVEIDSCGTGGWHAGHGADRRGVACAQRHGLDLRHHRARQLRQSDFHDFDVIFAMDQSNLRDLQRACPADATASLHLFLDGADVPDPYYGEDSDFDHVLALCQKASKRWVRTLSA